MSHDTDIKLKWVFDDDYIHMAPVRGVGMFQIQELSPTCAILRFSRLEGVRKQDAIPVDIEEGGLIGGPFNWPHQVSVREAKREARERLDRWKHQQARKNVSDLFSSAEVTS